MKSVVILSLDNQDLHTDSRIQRQILYLSKRYEVHVVTYGNQDQNSSLPAKSITVVGSLSIRTWSRKIKTSILLPIGRVIGKKIYEYWYWQRPGHQMALESVLNLKPDVIHANDWWTLPVAVEASKILGADIILDLHEYAPDEYSSLWWRILYKPVVDYFLKKYLPAIAGSITVNSVIAKRYENEYQITPIIVMNAPSHHNEQGSGLVDGNHIHLVHPGHAERNRQLEKMIDVVAFCDKRYLLSFILFGDERYIRYLRKYAMKKAPGRIIFVPPVVPSKLVNFLSQYDIGIYLTMDRDFNYYASLPNKFFEFVSAGLAVFIGPSPAMAELANQYGFGIVAPSFDPVQAAEVLNRLTAVDIEEMKKKAIEASMVLNADVEMEKLLGLYETIFDHRSSNKICDTHQ